MQGALMGWLGIVIVVGAVVATLGADFFRQQDTAAAAPPTAGTETGVRPSGGRVFWFTVVAVVLAVVAVIATVVRLASLA